MEGDGNAPCPVRVRRIRTRVRMRGGDGEEIRGDFFFFFFFCTLGDEASFHIGPEQSSVASYNDRREKQLEIINCQKQQQYSWDQAVNLPQGLGICRQLDVSRIQLDRQTQSRRPLHGQDAPK